ncbi:MAG TPA: 5-deoxy-glucuronate isomerase [Dermatophilaceae bacterium]|nr:5-deoxy-glucuronate isomerase [Dermatophilaceae bacterium]
MSSWVRPANSTARNGFEVAIGPREAGWDHTGMYVASLAAGESRQVATGDFEWLVVPLSGSVRVDCGELSVVLDGRKDVFSGPTDVAYVPLGVSFTVTSSGDARVALPHASASTAFPFRRIGAEQVQVELRGAGHATRLVRNFGTPGVLDADSIIACEVLTPAGNWSSYPPHKHDEQRPGQESALEEIYYFELQADAEVNASPIGYQRVYGTADRPIDVLAEVRTGDVVLVPHGWHGPAMAPPGYDMYYLNVMAGPGRREWLICDDPDHAWVRQTWATQPIDPRLAEGAHR